MLRSSNLLFSSSHASSHAWNMPCIGNNSSDSKSGGTAVAAGWLYYEWVAATHNTPQLQWNTTRHKPAYSSCHVVLVVILPQIFAAYQFLALLVKCCSVVGCISCAALATWFPLKIQSKLTVNSFLEAGSGAVRTGGCCPQLHVCGNCCLGGLLPVVMLPVVARHGLGVHLGAAGVSPHLGDAGGAYTCGCISQGRARVCSSRRQEQTALSMWPVNS